MRILQRVMSIIVICLLVCEPALVQGQETDRAHHSWGRFKPGAWKRVRLLAESLDEKGNVTNTSITETTTTLEAVSDTEYTLRIDVSVDVAGKRISAPSQVVKQGYNGETEGQKVTTKRVGESGLTISGQAFASEVREVVVNGGNSKRISTLHYSEKVSPFVLKRDTRSTDVDGKVTNFQTQVEVLAVDMPYKVLNDVKNASFIRTIHKQGKSATLTLEVHCSHVPGGVVSHTAKEDDETGRTIRRSTLELIDYGTENGPTSDESMMGRRRLFHRNRGRTSELTPAQVRI